MAEDTASKERRSFIKTAAAGAAGVIIGSAVGSNNTALAQDTQPAPLNTPITDLLGPDYAGDLTKNAKKLTKFDLMHLRKHAVRDDDAKITKKMKALNVKDLHSIEDAFDRKLQTLSGLSAAPPNGTTYCCCCTPCCTCAAAVTKPSRLA